VNELVEGRQRQQSEERVEVINPPTITMASGRSISEP
jgi:hypothetical protein